MRDISPRGNRFLGSWSKKQDVGLRAGRCPGDSVVWNPPANAEDVGSIPGSGRSSRVGNGNSLQYSCLENPHGQRSLVGHSPWGCKRAGHDLAIKTIIFFKQENRFQHYQ